MRFRPGVKYVDMLQDPGRSSKAGPQLQAVSLLLHLRLLSAYLAMPEPLAFAAEHETLSKLCAKALREGSLSGMAPVYSGQCS